MRELERIDRIQNKLTKYWKYYPDMRYFQFVSFVAGMVDNYDGDLFFYEDDAFEEMLEKLVGEKE